MAQGMIFDMDGVLLNSMPVWNKVGEWYLENQGKISEKNLSKILFSMTMAEGADYLKKQYALEESSKEIINGVNELIKDFYANKVELKPGVKELLEELKTKKINMTIATSTDLDLAISGLKRVGIFEYFTKIYSCSMFKEGKTNPEIFYAAQRTMHTEIENTYVIEDSLYSAKTAKKAGFKLIGVYDEISKDNQKDLTMLADIYVKETKDLLGMLF